MTRRKAAPTVAAVRPWRTEEVTLDRLRQHPDNPNVGDTEAIADAILELGYVPTIVARPHPTAETIADDTLEVLGGWHTAEALRMLKIGRAPVSIVQADDDIAARLLAALNRLPQLAAVEPDALARLLGKVTTGPRGLAGTGYDDADLARLLGHTPGTDDLDDTGHPVRGHRRRTHARRDPDALIAPPAKPITTPGDTWQLGAHRVLCAESLDDNGAAVLAALDDQRAAATITDPPYAIYGSSTGVASDVADDAMVRPFMEAAARLARTATAPFGHVYNFADWRSWASWWAAGAAAGLEPANMLIWDKGSGLGSMYANNVELVGFWVNTPERSMWTVASGKRTVLRPNVLRYPRPAGKEKEHNAAKPVDLLAELITNSTDPGGLVLDPFAGSGSTLIAAERTGRRCLAVDHKPKWCDVTVARWARLTGGKPLLNGKPHDPPGADG